MAEQLAAAHAQNKRLTATLQERDHTISQLRRENQELSETVALQAQTLREQEAALNAAVRVPAGAGPSPATRAGLPARHDRGWALTCQLCGALSLRRRRSVWVANRHTQQRSARRGAVAISASGEGMETEVGTGAARAGREGHRGGQGRPRALWVGCLVPVGAASSMCDGGVL